MPKAQSKPEGAEPAVGGRLGGALANRAADSYGSNSRHHTAADIDKVAASMRKLG
jgi:hypothetical protein